MPAWTWWDYIDDNGDSIVKKWLNTFLTKDGNKIKSKCVTAFTMADIEGKLSEPKFEKLEPPYDDLFRITIEVNNVPHKIIACYGTERGEVWMLACGKEHNNNYRPPGLLDTAHNRKNDILNGTRQVRSTCLLEKS